MPRPCLTALFSLVCLARFTRIAPPRPQGERRHSLWQRFLTCLMRALGAVTF
jgi:hypothetical protein